MGTSRYRPPEVEKDAFDTSCSLGSPSVDIVWLSEYGTILADENRMNHKTHLPSLCRPGISCYSLDVTESKYSHYDCIDIATKQGEPDPLHNLVKHRQHTQRSTTPIILVICGPDRIKLSRLLQMMMPRASTEEPDSFTTLNSIYGIIYLPKPRPRRLLHTSLLLVGELICCGVIRNYEVCRRSPGSCQSLSIQESILSSLMPLLEHLQNPSTICFFLLGLIYGVLGTLHYHMNRTDQLQRWFLFVGILTGVVIILPSLAKPDEGLSLAFPLAISATCALAFSTTVHWIWRTFLAPPSKRLDGMIDQWVQEAVKVDIAKQTVKFQEIV